MNIYESCIALIRVDSRFQRHLICTCQGTLHLKCTRNANSQYKYASVSVPLNASQKYCKMLQGEVPNSDVLAHLSDM